jgi:hypothetical protein
MSFGELQIATRNQSKGTISPVKDCCAAAVAHELSGAFSMLKPLSSARDVNADGVKPPAPLGKS